MKGRLTVYLGERAQLDSLKRLLALKIEHTEYTEYDFHRLKRNEDAPLITGEGRIVTYTFIEFVRRAVSLARTDGVRTALVDSFISRLDESVGVEKYFEPLLKCMDVFLFTTREDDVERLGTLPSEVYRIGAYTRGQDTTIDTDTRGRVEKNDEKIKIIGLGGMGRNALNALIAGGIDTEDTLYIDSDINALCACESADFIQLGRELTGGRGTGWNTALGLEAAMGAEAEITEAIRSVDRVILIAGMGGGLGGGAVAYIAGLATSLDKRTEAVVTVPATFEGVKKREMAEASLALLRDVLSASDIHIVENRGSLARAYPDTDERVREVVTDCIRVG